MAQYIDKDVLVAEIKKRIKEVSQIEKASYEIGLCDAYKTIISFLDTPEIKETDLEKEIDIEDIVHGTVDFPLIGCDFPNIYPNYKELKEYCERKGIKDNNKVKLIIIKDI